jgi:CHAD domain-containing protein
MVLRLETPHRPTVQFRRAVRQELDTALEALARRPPDVHDCRRTLKRARALVRLGEGAFPATASQPLRHRLRDAGRHLGQTRDAEALVEAVVRLRDRPEVPCPDALALVGSRLVWRRDGRDPHGAPATDVATGTAAARAAVDEAGRLLARRPPRDRGRGTRVFERGLLQIVTGGFEALERACADPTDPTTHHTLRKRAKELRHAVEFLEVIWPPVMVAWGLELHRLTDALGDAQDLSLVLEHLRDDPALGAGLDVEGLARAVEVVRSDRWAAARRLGRRVWAAPPADLTRDVMTWARIWSEPDA